MRLSDILYKKIIDQKGKELGHVMNVTLEVELTKQKDPIGKAKVVSLEYGKRALLERLGLKSSKTKSLPWKKVLKVEKSSILIRN